MDEQLPLFPAWPILADSEVMVVLRSAINRGILGSREADLYLAGTCERHLVANCGWQAWWWSDQRRPVCTSDA